MKFERVSYKQFEKDYLDCFPYTMSEEEVHRVYSAIQLPRRATAGSAGYDFFSPVSFHVGFEASSKIPTGIKVELPKHTFLMCVPRSGLGFKYGLTLLNTAGIIDGDYYNNPSNEGHIFAKVISRNPLTINSGDAFMQGIILPYFVTEDDSANGERVGGMGSTSK